MLVKVEITVEVDRAMWERIYGDVTPAEIRDGVREYVRHSIRDSGAAEDGAITGVERKAGR